jgi:hypothetical protein
VALLLLASGCSTFVSSRSQKEALVAAYRGGDLVQAADLATKKAERRADTGDELMWRLEEGSVRLAAGDAAGSLAALERAEAIIADHEARAVVSAREIGAEGGAILTNPNVLPYAGTYAEKIMLNTVKALAYLVQGSAEGARVELRRADERQRAAREHHAAEIEAAEAKARERQFTAAGLLAGSPELQEINTELDKAAGAVFADYVNPFTTYLSGISYLWQGNPGEAEVDFRNLHQMMPDHPRIRRDYATVLQALGRSPPPELGDAKPWPYPLHDRICLIVVEHGLAPARREQRIHIPLPPPVGYTGVAFPVMEYFPRSADRVRVRAPALHKATTLMKVADLDGIASRAYRSELPVMITRLAVSVIVKETANLAAMYAVRDQNAAVQIGTLIGTSLYKFVTNRADTRSWQCLPGEYRVGHLPMPPDGRFEVNGQPVELPPGTRRALLWIRTVPGGTPVVRVYPVP